MSLTGLVSFGLFLPGVRMLLSYRCVAARGRGVPLRNWPPVSSARRWSCHELSQNGSGRQTISRVRSPPGRPSTQPLGPGGEDNRARIGVVGSAPFDLRAASQPPLQSQIISQTGGDTCTCEGVCVRVVPTVYRLPPEVPTDFRGLFESEVDGCALIRRTEPCLCRRVPNNGNAVADKSSPQCAAVRIPVFPCQGGQEMQRKATCVCLGQWC